MQTCVISLTCCTRNRGNFLAVWLRRKPEESSSKTNNRVIYAYRAKEWLSENRSNSVKVILFAESVTSYKKATLYPVFCIEYRV